MPAVSARRASPHVAASLKPSLRGALLLRQGPRPTWEEAEACFQQARAIARQQQAKSWELRAAMSLARLWQQQGKRAAARDLLAPIYGWFTEGFDTADLQEAKALLEELGAETVVDRTPQLHFAQCWHSLCYHYHVLVMPAQTVC